MSSVLFFPTLSNSSVRIADYNTRRRDQINKTTFRAKVKMTKSRSEQTWGKTYKSRSGVFLGKRDLNSKLLHSHYQKRLRKKEMAAFFFSPLCTPTIDKGSTSTNHLQGDTGTHVQFTRRCFHKHTCLPLQNQSTTITEIGQYERSQTRLNKKFP